MNHHIILYTAYLIISILLTIWVGRTLFKNGRVFLRDIFHGDLELAEAVDKLLLVGFYLLNLGFAVYTMVTAQEIESSRRLMEVLSHKIGIIILVLGSMHFLNMFIFFKLRRREKYGY